jgi:alcohol dehydrogenase (cytochrome c)
LKSDVGYLMKNQIRDRATGIPSIQPWLAAGSRGDDTRKLGFRLDAFRDGQGCLADRFSLRFVDAKQDTTKAGIRCSRLRRNARDLTLKWVYQSRSLDKHEVTPLVVDGVMYTIQSPNDVVALDAATGKMIWQYLHKPADGTRNPCCGNLTRGVAILGEKLFLAALDARMIALDAKTGKEIWNVQIADYKQQYAMTVAPIVVKDKVITGVAGGGHGIRGFLAAYDANTGKEVWRFNTILGPGEAGYESWLGKDGKSSDSYLHGGAPIWVTGS